MLTFAKQRAPKVEFLMTNRRHTGEPVALLPERWSSLTPSWLAAFGP